MTPQFNFDNSYARLPARFYTRQAPSPVAKPGIMRVNTKLALELGLDPAELIAPDGLAILAGNAVPEGAEPLAQVYAGHQFGGWSPQLGDGRAVLLGELMTPKGRFDLQLKGSGQTPYSRMGDGRAWLGPVMREYIVSEAMHALSIPTTRALAAVTTGEVVMRERRYPGAVLTRIARSHIRVGTFQYFAAKQDVEALQTLCDHVIARHYPKADGPLGLLNAVIEAQAMLIAKWMAVGFIHGVMNTDNMSIAGETIDYGPCAFMDTYHPETVFSSIDHNGRYAYARQPDVAVWNLAQLATALLPLLGEREAAIERATEAVHRFPALFATAWQDTFRAKLGLTTPEQDDPELIQSLLDRMAHGQADFTNTFRALGKPEARDQFTDPTAYDTWAEVWQTRLAREGRSVDDALTLIARVNPAIIARNHRVEQAIAAGLNGDLVAFHTLTEALQTPFADHPGFAAPPGKDEAVTQTFCGT
ncbi:protein adenylyltransferase SelO [Oceaniglobus ichthyenteri]|uniref:protein adenylyltransferase SelO n=1 Tax=Oceaniglobus ichthyenteri TaxID=2136177 RepID=UPI000D38A9D5|nr:YdiU family protein [Oceaniglobus ichthyenteri]